MRQVRHGHQETPPAPEPAGAAAVVRVRGDQDLSLLDQSQNGVAILLGDTLAFANSALASWLAADRDALAGRPFATAFHPDDQIPVLDKLRALGQPGSAAVDFVARLANPDPVRWVRATGAACDYRGKPAAIWMMFDVTQAVSAESALRESEQRFRDLAENVAQTLFEFDLEGRFIYANSYGLQLFGYRPADLERGLWLVELLHPSCRERAQQDLRRVIAGETLDGEEYLLVRRDGTPIPVVVHCHRVTCDGRAVAARGVLVDVAERMRMEQALREARNELEARVRERTRELQETNARLLAEIEERTRVERSLRESEQRYRSLFEGAGDVVFSVGTDGRLRSLNRAFESLTGWPRDHWIDRHLLSVVHEDDTATVMHMVHESLRGEAVSPREIRLPTKQGEVRYVELSASPMWVEGVVVGVLGIARDLTERKRTEETLIRAERLAAVGTLAAGVAHEFNNLNATILGFTDLALERVEHDATLRDWLGRIKKSALRSNAIAQNLLAFCGPPAAPRACGNLATIVRETVAFARRQLEDSGAQVELDLQPVPDTRLDPGQISQAILQLVLNALQAMHGRENRRLTLSTGQNKQRIFVRVTDTGIGIPADKLPRIFSPFFTTKGVCAGSDPQAAFAGTGLGLSICHTVVQSHGGEIEVQSTPGQGSRFTIWLPLAPPEEPPDGVLSP